MKFKVLILSFILTACSSIRLQYETIVENKKTNERGSYTYEESRSVSGTRNWCLATGILYGGYCWAYLFLPNDEQKNLVMRNARQNLGEDYRIVTTGHAKRVNWTDSPSQKHVSISNGGQKSTPTKGTADKVFIKELYDDVSGTTYYIPNVFSEFRNELSSYLVPYIATSPNGEKVYRLSTQVQGEKSLHYRQIGIRCRDQRFTIKSGAFQKWNKDFDTDCSKYGCTTTESSDFRVSESVFKNLHSCSGNMKFRFYGAMGGIITKQYDANKNIFFMKGMSKLYKKDKELGSPQ